jgi:hypothetical protein
VLLDGPEEVLPPSGILDAVRAHEDAVARGGDRLLRALDIALRVERLGVADADDRLALERAPSSSRRRIASLPAMNAASASPLSESARAINPSRLARYPGSASRSGIAWRISSSAAACSFKIW